MFLHGPRSDAAGFVRLRCAAPCVAGDLRRGSVPSRGLGQQLVECGLAFEL